MEGQLDFRPRPSDRAKAAEGRRTPKPRGSSSALEPREASWSAVPLHRFGIGSGLSFSRRVPKQVITSN
jgi:hypothetical protein